jgi:hypothetical protein
MEPWQQVTVSVFGTVVTLLIGTYVWLNGRKTNRIRADEVEAQKTVEVFGANLELNKYIDARVAKLMEPANADIAELKGQVTELANREATTKKTLRRFFQKLIFWNEQGRNGDMPLPTRGDMDMLDISDLIPPLEGEAP